MKQKTLFLFQSVSCIRWHINLFTRLLETASGGRWKESWILPQGATVTLGEQSFTVEDGEADIEGYMGKVKITLFPYLDAEVTL